MIEFEIIDSPGPYGFGRTWQLQVTEHGNGGVVERTNTLYLGQNVKVASRIMGTDMDDLVAESVAATGSEDWDDNAPYVTDRLVECLRAQGATDEQFLTAQPWEMAAE